MTYVEAVRKGKTYYGRGRVSFYVVKADERGFWYTGYEPRSPNVVVVARYNPHTDRMVSELGLLGLLAHGVPEASARKLLRG